MFSCFSIAQDLPGSELNKNNKSHYNAIYHSLHRTVVSCYEKLFNSSSRAFMSQTDSQISAGHYEIVEQPLTAKRLTTEKNLVSKLEVQLPSYTDISH